MELHPTSLITTLTDDPHRVRILTTRNRVTKVGHFRKESGTVHWNTLSRVQDDLVQLFQGKIKINRFSKRVLSYNLKIVYGKEVVNFIYIPNREVRQ